MWLWELAIISFWQGCMYPFNKKITDADLWYVWGLSTKNERMWEEWKVSQVVRCEEQSRNVIELALECEILR